MCFFYVSNIKFKEHFYRVTYASNNLHYLVANYLYSDMEAGKEDNVSSNYKNQYEPAS